jgi:hypothetical protein
VADQVRVIIRALEDVTEQVIKKLTLDIVANLRRAPIDGGTPVDTGWARANWIANVSTPLTSPVGMRDAAGVSQASAAQQQGLGKVLAYKIQAGPVYISNNVDYIVKLNDGSSRQAPSGFVQRAIQEAVADLRGFVPRV